MKDIQVHKTIILIFVIVSCLTGCDYHYDVSVTNNTGSDILVKVDKKGFFYQYRDTLNIPKQFQPVDTKNQDTISFFLKSNDELRIGGNRGISDTVTIESMDYDFLFMENATTSFRASNRKELLEKISNLPSTEERKWEKLLK